MEILKSPSVPTHLYYKAVRYPNEEPGVPVKEFVTRIKDMVAKGETPYPKSWSPDQVARYTDDLVSLSKTCESGYREASGRDDMTLGTLVNSFMGTAAAADDSAFGRKVGGRMSLSLGLVTGVLLGVSVARLSHPLLAAATAVALPAAGLAGYCYFRGESRAEERYGVQAETAGTLLYRWNSLMGGPEAQIWSPPHMGNITSDVLMES